MASSNMTFSFVIATDDDLTPAVDLRGAYIHEIIMPAAWTAASIVFQCCETLTGTYQPFQLYGATDALEVKVEAGVRSGNLGALQIGDCFVKLNSVAVGSVGTGVGQGANRTVIVKVREGE